MYVFALVNVKTQRIVGDVTHTPARAMNLLQRDYKHLEVRMVLAADYPNLIQMY